MWICLSLVPCSCPVSPSLFFFSYIFPIYLLITTKIVYMTEEILTGAKLSYTSSCHHIIWKRKCKNAEWKCVLAVCEQSCVGREYLPPSWTAVLNYFISCQQAVCTVCCSHSSQSKLMQCGKTLTEKQGNVKLTVFTY